MPPRRARGWRTTPRCGCGGRAPSWARRGTARGARISVTARSSRRRMPARVVLDRPAGGVGQPQPGEELVGPPLGRAAGQPVEPPEQDEVLAAAEDLVDGRLLPAEPDAPPDRLGRAVHVRPRHPGAAAVGPQQGGQDADRRRLPRAVRSEQAAHACRREPPGRTRRGPDARRMSSPALRPRSPGFAARLVRCRSCLSPRRGCPCGRILGTPYELRNDNRVRRKELQPAFAGPTAHSWRPGDAS